VLGCGNVVFWDRMDGWDGELPAYPENGNVFELHLSLSSAGDAEGFGCFDRAGTVQ
jgi:hypothetical protein